MNPTPNFDGLARVYRWLEFATFGPALWRCRCHFLDQLGDSRKALVLGGGDGRFTACLLEANSDLRIDAVDASPAMLRALLKTVQEKTRSEYGPFAPDLRTWEPGREPYDLMVSHFFLDCLTDR